MEGSDSDDEDDDDDDNAQLILQPTVSMLTVFFSCLIVSSVSSSSQEVGRGTRGSAPPPFAFNLDLQGHYNLTQGHKLWLAGAPVFVHTDGHNYTTENGSLTLVHTQHHQGRDKVGQWVSTCFLYLAGSRHFQTCAKSWTNPQLPVIIFQQVRLLYRETSSVEFNSFFKRTKVEILNSLLRKKKKKKIEIICFLSEVCQRNSEIVNRKCGGGYFRFPVIQSSTERFWSGLPQLPGWNVWKSHQDRQVKANRQTGGIFL